MSCSFCNKDQVIAKGFCRACYYRLKKTGSLEYKRKGKPPKSCTFDDCSKPAVAKGYCDAHYRHHMKYGDAVSAFGYGDRRKHPLYDAWRQQVRCASGRVAEWDDFWSFVDFARDKPVKHIARRYEEDRPWGPANFYWHAPIASSKDKKEYARAWRKKNPIASKAHSLKKVFGITIQQYMTMYDTQYGRCAICGKPGMTYAGVSGRSDTLVVDHCHATGKIRSLLCAQCNKGIGCFNESPHLMLQAVSYLKRYTE